LLEDEVVGRRLDAVVDLHLPALLAQASERGVSDVGGGIDTELARHPTFSPQTAQRGAEDAEDADDDKESGRCARPHPPPSHLSSAFPSLLAISALIRSVSRG